MGDYVLHNLANLIGVPFVDGGRDYLEGLDCWGMLLEVYSRNGITLPDYKIIAFDSPSIFKNMEETKQYWLPVSEPEYLTVVSFAIDPHYPTFTQHFGVCLNERKFIHTRLKTGGVVEDINAPFWSKKRTGYWKWQG
jgi:cell wall-associated NlpC family hydrolase